MPVQDLYYKKYLKYKNKYLELKQYGGVRHDLISERALEDNKAKAEGRVDWPTPEIVNKRKAEDEAEAKYKNNIERRLEMDTLDSNKNKYIPLFLSYFADDSIIEFINFDNKHAVSWEAIEGGSEGYQEFDNYMQACEFVRDRFFRSYDSYDYDNKYTKWKIVDVETGAIMNMDEW